MALSQTRCLVSAAALLFATTAVGEAGSGDAAPVEPEIAAVEQWQFDDGQSGARFRVRLFGLVPVAGTFERLQGDVRVDRVRGVAVVTATLPTTGVRMKRTANATWAKSAEFFDAARHPEISFVSSELPLKRLAEGGVIEGKLTLRGLTREVSFVLKDADCTLAAASICKVDVAGQIDRSKFGMTTRRGTLANGVSLNLHIVAARS